MKRAIVTTISIFVLSMIGSVHADDSRTAISPPGGNFPITISKPGSYYLTGNVYCNQVNTHAIEITCNDATIDLNGFTISGPNREDDQYSCGIYAYNKDTISVKNGRVWGFACGLDLTEGSGHLVREIQTPNNDYGIKIDGGVVSNCTASNNKICGFLINHSITENCIANNNGENGFFCSYATVRFCNADSNGKAGFNGRESLFFGCLSTSNQEYGFVIFNSALSNYLAVSNNENVYEL